MANERKIGFVPENYKGIKGLEVKEAKTLLDRRRVTDTEVMVSQKAFDAFTGKEILPSPMAKLYTLEAINGEIAYYQAILDSLNELKADIQTELAEVVRPLKAPVIA